MTGRGPVSAECFALCLHASLPCNPQHWPGFRLGSPTARFSSDIYGSQTSAAQKILLPELVLLGWAFPSPYMGNVPRLPEGQVLERRCVLWKFKGSRICPRCM